MRGLTFLLMLLGALGVLMLGAVPASAMGGGGAAPCHEMAMGAEPAPDAPAPVHDNGKAMASMTCCVSCVAAPCLQPPSRPAAIHPEAPQTPRPTALPAGLTPAPEPGPPRG